MRRALQSAGLDKSKLNVVVMVGGSSRIPKVAELLKEYFGQVPVLLDDNCEYAIAMGAAKLASAADTLEDDEPVVVVEEIMPWSLGVEVEDGRMHALIRRGERLPVKRTRIFTTVLQGSVSAVVKVYEGNDEFVAGNRLIGDLHLDDLQLAPDGHPQVEITFEYDSSRILRLTWSNGNAEGAATFELALRNSQH